MYTNIKDYLEANRLNILDLIKNEEVKKYTLQVKYDSYKHIIENQFRNHIINLVVEGAQKSIPLDYLLVYTEVEDWLYGSSVCFDSYNTTQDV